MTRPVWLLDLDGVVNAVPRVRDPLPNAWPRDTWISVEMGNSYTERTWPILASRQVVEFINEVDDNYDIDILWHSTWQQDANKVAAAIGLHEFEVLAAPEHEGWTKGARGWWKLPGAQRMLRDRGGHLIWTDDDACFPDISREERKLFRDAGALVIAPNPQQGLVRSNLDRIRFYLSGPDETAVAA